MRPYYGHPPACTCAACTGVRPQRRFETDDGDGNGDWQIVDCPTCQGTGKIYAGWSNPDQGHVARCPRCLGKGKIRQSRSTRRHREDSPPRRTRRPTESPARGADGAPSSRPTRRRRPIWEDALEDAAAAPNPHAGARQTRPSRPAAPSGPNVDVVRPGGGSPPPPPRPPRGAGRPRRRRRGGWGFWIALLFIAVIGAAVFVGINPTSNPTSPISSKDSAVPREHRPLQRQLWPRPRRNPPPRLCLPPPHQHPHSNGPPS